MTRPAVETAECWLCCGEGTMETLDYKGEFGVAPCPDCKGSGRIAVEFAEHVAKGAAK